MNLTAIDFTVSRQQLYKIRGRVIDSRSGQSPGAVTIQIRSESPTGESEIIAFSSGAREVNASYNATDGTFEIRNVAPGSLRHRWTSCSVRNRAELKALS